MINKNQQFSDRLLANAEDESILGKIRGHTRSGKPIGDDRFISDLENK